MTQLPAIQAVTAAIGRALFLVGVFWMITGDWPRSTLLPDRWAVPLTFLSWPWLYPLLLGASVVLLASSGVLGVTRPTAADFLYWPLALLSAAFFLSVVFSQVPELSAWAFACYVVVLVFALAMAGIVGDLRPSSLGVEWSDGYDGFGSSLSRLSR